MPSSKTKLRGKSTKKSHLQEKGTPEKDTNHNHAKKLLELKKEKESLEAKLEEFRKDNEELMLKKEKHLKELNLDLYEKETLLEECLELNTTEPKRKNKKKITKPKPGEHFLMPYELDSIKKLGNLSGRLIKELISLKEKRDEYIAKYIDEEYQMKTMKELLETANVSRMKGLKGRLCLETRVEELRKKLSEMREELSSLKVKSNDFVKTSWQEASGKYEEILKQLTDERAKLQKEFLEKEKKLKDIKAKQIILEKEIEKKNAKIERQTDANEKKISGSAEFTNLVEERNVLLSRIDRSVKIIEDTKEAYSEVEGKAKELNLNLLKNQKRVEELTTKLTELQCVTEGEKMKTINTSSVLEYVSQELNSKNGILLKLESELEELEFNREMLTKNLQYCDEQRELLRKENSNKTKRMSEIISQYFEPVDS